AVSNAGAVPSICQGWTDLVGSLVMARPCRSCGGVAALRQLIPRSSAAPRLLGRLLRRPPDIPALMPFSRGHPQVWSSLQPSRLMGSSVGSSASSVGREEEGATDSPEEITISQRFVQGQQRVCAVRDVGDGTQCLLPESREVVDAQGLRPFRSGKRLRDSRSPVVAGALAGLSAALQRFTRKVFFPVDYPSS
ncbi:unnamed protein product, partial [Polarella glacialis]